MTEVGKEGGCGQEIPRGIVGLERVEAFPLPTRLSTGQILAASEAAYLRRVESEA
jgi:hypothetical protein